jgi:hypothetical protein
MGLKEEVQAKLKEIYLGQEYLPQMIKDDSFPKERVEDYVPLQINVVRDDTAEITAIEIERIFDEAGLVLLKGNAGVGKTTVETYLAHLWAIEIKKRLAGEFDKGLAGEFDKGLVDKFDYVFKVKLKLLTNDNWHLDYGIDERSSYPLACFIHYALNQSMLDAEDRISFEQIKAILANKKSRDKILLLFDNVEDVVHLMDKPGMVKNVMDQALSLHTKYSKYSVMVTSRPNCLTGELESMFDLKLWTNGFDEKGTELYIKQLFAKQYARLKVEVNKFLEQKEDASNMDQLILSYFWDSQDASSKEILILLKKIPAIEGERNKEWIIKAIDNYYKEIEKSLDRLLMDPSVKELTSNALNAAMLAIYLSDPEVIKRLEQGIKANDLYKYSVLLAGKRKISKDSEQDPNRKKFKDITEQDVLNTKEFKALMEVAYQSLLQDKYLSGEEINAIAEKYGIGIKTLYEYGVLKITYRAAPPADANVLQPGLASPRPGMMRAGLHDPDDLRGNNLRFIHVGFKEYMGAFSVVEKLKSADAAIYNEAIDLISNHRNDPTYLSLLKIVAGVLSEEGNHIAIDRFWMAILRNLPDKLEFGAERKVTLLMHLLAQTKADDYIPLKETAIKFIDDFILADFVANKQLIKDTGYLSPKMEVHIWNVLNHPTISDSHASKIPLIGSYKPVLNPELLNIIDISGRFLDKLDNGDLLKRLMGYLADADLASKVGKFSMYLIGRIVKSSRVDLSIEEVDDIVAKVGGFIDDKGYKRLVIKALEALIYVNKDNEAKIEAILHQLLVLIKTKEKNDSIYMLISKIVENAGNNVVTNQAFKIVLDDLVKMIKENNLGQGQAMSSRSSSTKQLATEKSEESKQKTLNAIEQTIEMIISKFEGEERGKAVALVMARMKILVVEDSNTKNDVAFIIGKLLLLNNNREAQQEVFDLIMSHLNDLSSQKTIIDLINSALDDKSKMDVNFLSPILVKLTDLIANPGDLNLGDIIGAVNKILNAANNLEEIDLQVRKNALNALLKLNPEVYPKLYYVTGILALRGDKEMLDGVLELLMPWFEMGGTQPIEDIERAMENLTSGEIPVDFAVELLAKLIPLLHDGDARLAKSIVNVHISDEIIAKLAPLLNEKDAVVDNPNLDAEASAASPRPMLNGFMRMIGMGAPVIDNVNNEEVNLPSVSEYIVNILLKLIRHKNDSFAKKASLAIEVIIQQNPLLKGGIYLKLVEILNTKHSRLDHVMLLIGRMDAVSEDDYETRLDDFVNLLNKGICDKSVFIEAMSYMIRVNANARIPKLEKFFLDAKKYDKVISSIARVVVEVVEEKAKEKAEGKEGAEEVSVEVINAIFYQIVEALPNSEDRSVKAGVIHAHAGLIYAISKLLGKIDNLDLITKNMFRNLMLSLTKDKLSLEAIEAINYILSNKDIIDHITPKLDAQYVLVDRNKEVFDKIFDKLKAHLIDKAGLSTVGQASSSMSGVASSVMTKVGRPAKEKGENKEIFLIKKAIENLTKLWPLEKVIHLLNHEIEAISKIAIDVLIYKVKEFLKDKPESNEEVAPEAVREANRVEFDSHYADSRHGSSADDEDDDINIWKSKANYMLEILKYDINERILATKKLHKLAHKLLHKYARDIDADGDDIYNANLDWVVKNFDALVLKNSANNFMKLVFHKTLSDAVITEAESVFILRCIQDLKFTVIIGSKAPINDEEASFTVGFEGREYELVGEVNRKYIEQIAHVALQNQDDALAVQYAEASEVIFPTAGGTKRAAIDVKANGCSSLLAKDNALSADRWKVSFMYKADHKGGDPTDVFVFLETRDLLGNYVGYKLVVAGEGKITAAVYRSHPDEIDTSFREGVFSAMEYTSVAKTMYMGATIEIHPSDNVRINLSELNDVVIQACSDVANKRAYFGVGMSTRNFGPEALYRRMTHQQSEQDTTAPGMKALHKIFNDHLKLRVKLAEQEIVGKWNADKGTFTEYTRAELLALPAMRRADSLVIDTADANNNLNEKAEEFKTKINFEALTRVLAEDELKEKSAEQLKEIDADTYRAAFYLRIVQIINSVFIAASSISTQMVENKSSGTAGTIGDILESISPHIPFAGLVLQLMGDVFHAIDADNEEAKIKKFMEFAQNPDMIRIIADKIGRHLCKEMGKHNQFDVKNAVNVVREDVEEAVDGAKEAVDTAMELRDAASAAVTLVGEVAKKGVGGTVVTVCKNLTKKLPSVFKRAIPDNETPAERLIRENGQAGEDDAIAIAGFIVQEAFAGKFVKNKWGVSVAEVRAARAVEAVNKKYPLVDRVEPEVPVDADDIGLVMGGDATNTANDSGGGKKPEDKHSSCIVMNVRVEDCIDQTPEFQELLKLPLEERVIAMNKLLNDHSSENFFLKDAEGRAFLNKFEALYGLDSREMMEEFGENQEFVDKMLAEVRIHGIEEGVLSVIGAKKEESSVDILDVANSIQEEGQELNAGFYQYIHNALSTNNKHYSKMAQDTLKAIANLQGRVKELVNKGAEEHETDEEFELNVDTALWMLDGLLEIVDSGLRPIPMHRPPAYDPGGDYGPGSGGGGSSGGDKSDKGVNQTGYTILLPFVSSFDGNFTGESTNHKADAFHDM